MLWYSVLDVFVESHCCVPCQEMSGPPGQRWIPDEVSPQALAQKAVDECEDAEPYNHQVRLGASWSLVFLNQLW